MVITDKKGLIQAGILDTVESSLKEAGIAVNVFSDVEENPSVETVHAAGELLKKGGYKLVIGLGGGSSIDTAKCASIVATNPGSIIDYEGIKKVGLGRTAMMTVGAVSIEMVLGTALAFYLIASFVCRG
ncbi:MAG: iron-containing alcohol dehydrogenase [Dethiobacteria bacterium]|nr:iron-containing alcohol dehydrogenase [Bacillota bacterium]